MPYWVVTSELHRMGPYNTESRAQQVVDGLDADAEVFKTTSSSDAVAVQELRHQLIEREGAHMAHRNFKKAGV